MCKIGTKNRILRAGMGRISLSYYDWNNIGIIGIILAWAGFKGSGQA
jgi:hypothetical protein